VFKEIESQKLVYGAMTFCNILCQVFTDFVVLSGYNFLETCD